MQAAFVPRTHFAFTCGRDGTLCYWDCDKFEKLLVLDGHFGEAWALAVSGGGDMVVTGGHDRSLRRWERTDEPFFVEEEKERRLESMWEEGAGGDEERRKVGGGLAWGAGERLASAGAPWAKRDAPLDERRTMVRRGRLTWPGRGRPKSSHPQTPSSTPWTWRQWRRNGSQSTSEGGRPRQRGTDSVWGRRAAG